MKTIKKLQKIIAKTLGLPSGEDKVFETEVESPESLAEFIDAWGENGCFRALLAYWYAHPFQSASKRDWKVAHGYVTLKGDDAAQKLADAKAALKSVYRLVDHIPAEPASEKKAREEREAMIAAMAQAIADKGIDTVKGVLAQRAKANGVELPENWKKVEDPEILAQLHKTTVEAAKSLGF